MEPNPNANQKGAANYGGPSFSANSLLKEDLNNSIKERAVNLLDGVKISKDDFQFLKVIGRGSFGKVYMVKKKDKMDEVFAMKVLAKNVLNKKNLLIKTQGKQFLTLDTLI
jgi:serine/threonine protein kinase